MRPDSPPEGASGPPPRDVDPLKGLAQHSGGIGSMGAAGKYAGIGLQFALSIVLFLYLGQWVDRKLGTDGIFMLLGVMVGFGAAFFTIYRSLMADQRREEEAEAARKKAASAKEKQQ